MARIEGKWADTNEDLKKTKELASSNAFDINSREYITRLQNILSHMLISIVPNGERENRTATSTSSTGILVFGGMRLFKFLKVWNKDDKLKDLMNENGFSDVSKKKLEKISNFCNECKRGLNSLVHDREITRSSLKK